MGFYHALVADGLSLSFWLLVGASLVIGFFWVESLVEHLAFRPGWKLGVLLAGTIATAVMVNGQVEELRLMSQEFETGEATFTAVVAAFWLMLSAICLIGPFLLLFSSSGRKEP